MAEHYLLTDDGGKVTAKRIKKNRSGHWEAFGSVELYDLPLDDLRIGVETRMLVERHGSKR